MKNQSHASLFGVDSSVFRARFAASWLLLGSGFAGTQLGCSAAGEEAEPLASETSSLSESVWQDDFKRSSVGVSGSCRAVPECAPYTALTCDTNQQRYRTFPEDIGVCDLPGTNSCLAPDATNGGLDFHGADRWSDGRGWQGFPLITRDSFNRNGYISVELPVRAYAGPLATSGAFFGLALYNGESNYREIAYRSIPGSSEMTVWRFAGGSCDPSSLNVTVAQNSTHKLRVDYFGQDGGKWIYYVDDVVRKIENVSVSNRGSILAADPRIGLFFVGGQDGAYVEGHMGTLSVWTGDNLTASQLRRDDGLSATNSRYYAQEILAPGTIARVRLFFGAAEQRWSISAYTDAGGRPGTRINETLYVSDRYGFQDVPLWVPSSLPRIWLVAKSQTATAVDLGTSAPASNPYSGTLLSTNNSGVTWSAADRDFYFAAYAR